MLLVTHFAYQYICEHCDYATPSEALDARHARKHR